MVPVRTLLSFCLPSALALSQWAPLAPLQSPPGMVSPVMAYDLSTQRILLLDGNQLWAFDGTTWAPVASAHQPPDHRFRRLSYDINLGTTMTFGGQPSSVTSTDNVDETWVWDGLDWTLAAPLSTPGGRARYALCYDLGRSRHVLYGGEGNPYQPGSIRQDTWEWDGSNWTSSPAGGPGPRYRATMCYAVHLARCVLFGGQDSSQGQPNSNDDTWLYDGTQWQVAPVVGPRPAPRIDATMAYDFVRQVCVLTGGADPLTYTVFDDTWEFDGTSWRQVGPGTAPPRTDAGMIYDIARGRMRLFGGRTQSTAIRSDTLEFGANQRTYGLGCLGTFGRPTLQRGQPPVLGGTGTLTLTNLDPAAGLCAFTYGFSHSAWAFGSLPASLAFAGMPGCVALASADEVVLVAAAGGQATWTFAVPGNAQLFGLEVYVQAISIDPARNAAGLVSSNGAILTLGW